MNNQSSGMYGRTSLHDAINLSTVYSVQYVNDGNSLSIDSLRPVAYTSLARHKQV